jgi:hypothetical protein
LPFLVGVAARLLVNIVKAFLEFFNDPPRLVTTLAPRTFGKEVMCGEDLILDVSSM